VARQVKFTPVVIPQISSWVSEGFSSFEIAEKIGCTLGTLRVRCSQLGISLRQRGSRDKQTYTISADLGDLPAKNRQAGGNAMQTEKLFEGRENLLVLSIPQFTLKELRQVASSKGTPVRSLPLRSCKKLLRMIYSTPYWTTSRQSI
jgi:hypothetical protein